MDATCWQAGIAFVGPPSKVIQRFGDKTEARELAREFNVPIVPGTEHSVTSLAGAKQGLTLGCRTGHRRSAPQSPLTAWHPCVTQSPLTAWRCV